MVLISHPTSNANSRAVVEALAEEKMLVAFHTSIAAFPDTFLYNLGNISLLSEIKRRSFPSLLKDYTTTNSSREIGRLLASKMKVGKLTQHEKGLFCIDAVYKHQDKKISQRLKQNKDKGLRAVYAYEDGALHSFQTARTLGISTIYDLPIGYWRASNRMLEIENEKWPEYSDTLIGLKDSETKLKKKDKELALADHIYVASSFTASTLEDYPGSLNKISIIPYGFPPVIENREYNLGKKLKILFVGGLSQRKGIAYLFEAAEKLKNHLELTVVGMKVTNSCDKLNSELKKHHWIPTLTHSEVLKTMREHDVLVFPSLFEGFGMVITEAMSQGTPVITTNRTAGPDLIKNEENGWIIEAGSTNSLVKVLVQLLENRKYTREIGMNAQHTASKRPWKKYGEELTASIKKDLSKDQ